MLGGNSDYSDEAALSGVGRLLRQTTAWQDAASFLKSSSSLPVGSLAFIIDSDEMLVKLSQGWRTLIVLPPQAQAEEETARI